MTQIDSPQGIINYEYGYDSLGRQKTVTIDPLDVFGLYAQTVSSYDNLGRQETVTDPADMVTRFVHDAAGRVIQTIADEGYLNVVTETKYDDAGRRIAEIDALGQRTDSAYDTSGRLIGVQLPMVQDQDPNSPTAGQWVNPSYKCPWTRTFTQLLNPNCYARVVPEP